MEEDKVRGEGMMTAENNQIPGWKYYNHAAIPTTAPHENPDLTPLKDERIWHIEGKKPLLVRYTTDWDCGYDTGWWYLIREAPFNIEELSKNSRKHIKEAFRKVRVEKIDPRQYVDELYECYHQAFLKYEKADNEVSCEVFKKGCLSLGLEYWAGFAIDSGKVIGFMTVASHEDWAEIHTSKFHPEYLKLRASDALYATVLGYYLNSLHKHYVSSGSRSINHITNTQEYKEDHFGFRKAYCKLHLIYLNKVKFIFKFLYLLRSVISVLGSRCSFFHRISAILKMDEITRNI